jgi:hypothetical protein
MYCLTRNICVFLSSVRNVPINVHFALCASSILNPKRKTTKNGFLTIMLTKRIFDPQKTDTDFFEGRFADGVAVDLGVFLS